MMVLSFFLIEDSRDAHGVLREVWYKVNYNSKKAPTMRENPAFQPPAQSRTVLRDFDAPTNIRFIDVERLTSYLQVKVAVTHLCTQKQHGYQLYVKCLLSGYLLKY